jgi:hypothetical protein
VFRCLDRQCADARHNVYFGGAEGSREERRYVRLPAGNAFVIHPRRQSRRNAHEATADIIPFAVRRSILRNMQRAM